MIQVSIELTPCQRDQVAWAIDPMHDYWCVPCEWSSVPGGCEAGGPVRPEEVLPRLEGSTLVLSDRDTTGDLVYRLGRQLQDMADSEGTPEAYGTARAGMNVCHKIADALPEEDFEPDLQGL